MSFGIVGTILFSLLLLRKDDSKNKDSNASDGKASNKEAILKNANGAIVAKTDFNEFNKTNKKKKTNNKKAKGVI
jgi:hypothetical protein